MSVGTQSTDGWSERGKKSTSPLPSGILKQEAERAAATSLGLQPFSAKLHKLTIQQPSPHLSPSRL